MCIVLYSLDNHPRYKLILASNRDEFLARETDEARWRSGRTLDAITKEGGRSVEEDGKVREDGSGLGRKAGRDEVLCGLDRSGGGTWLGLDGRGRVGILTNYTEPPPATKPTSTRGSLVTHFLSPSNPFPCPSAYTSDLALTAHTYSAFNLLLFDLFPPPSSSSLDPSASPASSSICHPSPSTTISACSSSPSATPPSSTLVLSPSLSSQSRHPSSQVSYLSNRSIGSNADYVPTSKGVDGMSNSLMGEPWVKVRDGKHRLSQLINDEESGVSSWPEEVWIAKLASVMSSVHEKPNFIKEDAPLSTCIPPIRFPHPVTGKPAWYATRLSTFLLVSHTGEYTFVERDLWCLNEDGEPTRDTQAGQKVFRGRLDL